MEFNAVSDAVDIEAGPPRGRPAGRTEHRLHLGGVDAFGIVYYTRYWDWYQHAFEELLRELGHPLPTVLEKGHGFPVVHAEIDYRRALLLDETVHCEVWPFAVGDRSLRLAGRFLDGDGELLAAASTVHVISAQDRSRVEMPAWLRDAAVAGEG